MVFLQRLTVPLPM